MSQTGTSAWWADVQYLRDAAERTDEARRRADRAELAARRASRDRRRVEAETAPAPQGRRVESDQPPQRRRLEPDPPSPRRRDHADAGAAPRRGGYADGAAAVPRRGGYADGAAAVPRRGGYADGAAAVPRRGGSGNAVALPGRRTIEIRGRTVPAPDVPRAPRPAISPRRPPRLAAECVGPRPDRIAMWALLMGIVLILVALTT
jgi:hypothetical protein